MRSRTVRLLAVAVAFAVAIGVGGAIGLAARPSPSIDRDAVGRSSSPAPLPPRRPVRVDTMLAWTYGPLPDGFAARIAALPAVAHAVAVVSGTAWLTRSYSGDGALVDRPAGGLAIPLEVAAADLRAYVPFLSPAHRILLPELERGQAVLGTASAGLRRLGAGGALLFGRRRVTVAGVVSDEEVGAHEVFLSRAAAARLGVTEDRYVLIDPRPGVSRDRLAARIRALLPAGVPLRVRGPGETTFLRQGDAVLAPVFLKRDFGEFAARPVAGGFLQVEPSWEAAHIVDARVPILGRVRCNRGILPQLRGALGDVEGQGLAHLVDPSEYGGCFVPKFIRNNPASAVSHHTWGVAVDLDVGQNPFGHTPHMDRRIVDIFERWGFIWGGRFLVPDGMHFEFVRFSSGG
ncbi:MAG: M15 family metallopeptidase [Actinomycetota bacterium]